MTVDCSSALASKTLAAWVGKTGYVCVCVCGSQLGAPRSRGCAFVPCRVLVLRVRNTSPSPYAAPHSPHMSTTVPPSPLTATSVHSTHPIATHTSPATALPSHSNTPKETLSTDPSFTSHTGSVPGANNTSVGGAHLDGSVGEGSGGGYRGYLEVATPLVPYSPSTAAGTPASASQAATVPLTPLEHHSAPHTAPHTRHHTTMSSSGGGSHMSAPGTVQSQHGQQQAQAQTQHGHLPSEASRTRLLHRVDVGDDARVPAHGGVLRASQDVVWQHTPAPPPASVVSDTHHTGLPAPSHGGATPAGSCHVGNGSPAVYGGGLSGMSGSVGGGVRTGSPESAFVQRLLTPSPHGSPRAHATTSVAPRVLHAQTPRPLSPPRMSPLALLSPVRVASGARGARSVGGVSGSSPRSVATAAAMSEWRVAEFDRRTERLRQQVQEQRAAGELAEAAVQAAMQAVNSQRLTILHAQAEIGQAIGPYVIPAQSPRGSPAGRDAGGAGAGIVSQRSMQVLEVAFTACLNDVAAAMEHLDRCSVVPHPPRSPRRARSPSPLSRRRELWAEESTSVYAGSTQARSVCGDGKALVVVPPGGAIQPTWRHGGVRTAATSHPRGGRFHRRSRSVSPFRPRSTTTTHTATRRRGGSPGAAGSVDSPLKRRGARSPRGGFAPASLLSMCTLACVHSARQLTTQLDRILLQPLLNEQRECELCDDVESALDVATVASLVASHIARVEEGAEKLQGDLQACVETLEALRAETGGAGCGGSGGYGSPAGTPAPPTPHTFAGTASCGGGSHGGVQGAHGVGSIHGSGHMSPVHSPHGSVPTADIPLPPHNTHGHTFLPQEHSGARTPASAAHTRRGTGRSDIDLSCGPSRASLDSFSWPQAPPGGSPHDARSPSHSQGNAGHGARGAVYSHPSPTEDGHVSDGEYGTGYNEGAGIGTGYGSVNVGIHGRVGHSPGSARVTQQGQSPRGLAASGARTPQGSPNGMGSPRGVYSAGGGVCGVTAPPLAAETLLPERVRAALLDGLHDGGAYDSVGTGGVRGENGHSPRSAVSPRGSQHHAPHKARSSPRAGTEAKSAAGAPQGKPGAHTSAGGVHANHVSPRVSPRGPRAPGVSDVKGQPHPSAHDGVHGSLGGGGGGEDNSWEGIQRAMSERVAQAYAAVTRARSAAAARDPMSAVTTRWEVRPGPTPLLPSDVMNSLRSPSPPPTHTTTHTHIPPCAHVPTQGGEPKAVVSTDTPVVTNSPAAVGATGHTVHAATQSRPAVGTTGHTVHAATQSRPAVGTTGHTVHAATQSRPAVGTTTTGGSVDTLLATMAQACVGSPGLTAAGKAPGTACALVRASGVRVPVVEDLNALFRKDIGALRVGEAENQRTWEAFQRQKKELGLTDI